ncbi:MAG: hypothetical protein RBT64_01145 [Trichloromonas sp.]|jgi:hypothetical protein|nr:hypothetical protein [Trichloromonas sp.]
MKREPECPDQQVRPDGAREEKPGIFDNPRNVQRLLQGFYSCVVILLLVDLFYHKHALFPWEEKFGFYAIYGFVACVILVLVAKYILRPLVMRKEDYYD